MHMADALVSPAVGGTVWAATAGLIAYSAREVKRSSDDRLAPMMGVLGAFVFAAQMINFSIPLTGSSGHLGGGLLLAILLGPHAAFLTIASVLVVQALFFADGGILALGCNIFNMGFFPAFIVYPLLYRPLAGDSRIASRLWPVSILSAVVALLLGASGVVLETTLSGVSELPFRTFILLMLPIHLAIGIVEGLATAAVVGFVARARPEAVNASPRVSGARGDLRPVLIGLLAAAVVVGAAVSWFASTHPDGLEWSIAKVSGSEEVAGASVGVHERLAQVQETTAFLPDYGFKSNETEAALEESSASESEAWPAVDAGTSVSGLIGGTIAFLLAGIVGFGLKRRRVAAVR
ncbi:energy-coupling factor ABC transporter permease [Candidatus Sumerlaeota bacterium]|nr:energy-coupling factor ABC transporter permease [Candidatus Sumerlaeota bacterium]